LIKSKLVTKKKPKSPPADLQLHEVEFSPEDLAADASQVADAFDPRILLTDSSSGTTSQDYQGEEFIFLQGDAADAVFYIQRGKVKLTVVSQSGIEVVVASLPEASFFGEGCLAGQPLRLSSAISVQETTIVRVTKEAMATLLQQKPKFAERLLTYLLSRNVRIESDWVEVKASGDMVLCIDDEPHGLVARKAILRKKGYEVLTALSGPEGLKLFKTNPVDAVVLDYSMPGMDGGQVAAELKRMNPDIKILLLSAYVDIPQKALQYVDKQSLKGMAPTSFVADIEQLLSW
jgi:CheY-like chemotaxis protein